MTSALCAVPAVTRRSMPSGPRPALKPASRGLARPPDPGFSRPRPKACSALPSLPGQSEPAVLSAPRRLEPVRDCPPRPAPTRQSATAAPVSTRRACPFVACHPRQSAVALLEVSPRRNLPSEPVPGGPVEAMPAILAASFQAFRTLTAMPIPDSMILASDAVPAFQASRLPRAPMPARRDPPDRGSTVLACGATPSPALHPRNVNFLQREVQLGPRHKLACHPLRAPRAHGIPRRRLRASACRALRSLPQSLPSGSPLSARSLPVPACVAAPCGPKPRACEACLPCLSSPVHVMPSAHACLGVPCPAVSRRRRRATAPFPQAIVHSFLSPRPPVFSWCRRAGKARRRKLPPPSATARRSSKS